ncbi:MAG: glycosyltransferase family 4 protein [Bacteroidales bacterium]|nr:glycosyltransferase family 4 protein [Bacteroidales bacterium]
MEGIQWFTFETFKRITQAHPEHTFYFIFDRPFQKEFIFSSNVKPLILSPQARHPFLFYIWFHLRIPQLLKKYDIDVFVSPDGFLPLKSKVPSLAVIHDINFEHQTKGIPFFAAKYYKHYFPKYALIASKIATVSKYSKNDIIKTYNIVPSKISVVYNGINESFGPISEIEKAAVRKKYAEGNPYFIFVGSLHPRKNLCNLLKAFDEYKKTDQTNTRLLVIGSKLFKANKIFKTYNEMSYRDNVHFHGHLFADELHAVLAAAKALTFVSFFEGFGIPIVEAFACETPVITSNISSMPEIAGDAALLINPHSIEKIQQALHEIEDEALRKKLIEKGNKQKMKFSWNKTAEKLWEDIEGLFPVNKKNKNRNL